MNPLAMLGLPDFSQGLLSGMGVSPKTLTLAGLQGLTSAGSVMAQMGQTRRAGYQQSWSDMLSAQNDLANAQAAEVAGKGEVAGLRIQLANSISARDAAAAASGVDAGGQGTASWQRQQMTQGNDVATQVASLNADIASRRYQANAINDAVRAQLDKSNADATASAQGGAGLLSALMSAGKLLLAAPTGGASLAA
jgi:hypothetical protein